MRGNSDYQSSGEFVYSKAYEEVFIRRVHQLLVMGYATMPSNEFSNAQEEDITGELTRAINSVLDNASAPHWTDSFTIHEEPRINDPNRKGKRRRRLDIRIDSSISRPRSRLCFEAKRLGLKNSENKYLGTDGLQRFLDGRYARDYDIGGMLGYVQDGNCDEWAQKIGTAIVKDKKKLGLMTTSPWRKEKLTEKVPFTYRSGHKRPEIQRQIEIYHTLLCFN